MVAPIKIAATENILKDVNVVTFQVWAADTVTPKKQQKKGSAKVQALRLITDSSGV